MAGQVRLCMIGAGGHSSRNIYPCFRLLRDAQVVANADIDLARAQGLARLHGLERSYCDYRQMLEKESPDGVIVCVGPEFHARTACELLALGYNVMTEKPPAASLAQCREVVAAQSRSGKICMTAFKKRFAPAGARLKEVVADAAFGAPSTINVLRTRRQHGTDLAACLAYILDSTVHMFDFACWLFGEGEEITALRNEPTSTSMLIRFRCGAVGGFVFPTTVGNQRIWEEVTVTGSGGVLARMENSTEMMAFREGQPFAGYKPEWCFGGCNSAQEMGFVPELQAFADAIGKGETQPESSIESVLPGMALLEAALASLRNGGTVRVERA